MEITEVRIKLMGNSDDRLLAFCSITFDDCFVIRDLKIIDGANGPFVAMPSRKLTSHCPQCSYKNHLRAAYCNQCGARQNADRAARDADGRVKLYADVAHPINSECREMIQQRVIEEFDAEVERSHEPGYVSRYDEAYDDYDVDEEYGARANPSTDSGAASKEETRIQPPQTSPRGPHKSPTRESLPARPKDTPSDRGNDEFGAGIF